MINLLPYNRRILLKSQYKTKLIVVAVFSTIIAILPFAIIMVVIVFLKYSNISVLEKTYKESLGFKESQGVTELLKNVTDTNSLIISFQKNLKNTKPVSNIINQIVSIHPATIKINSLDFKTSVKDGDTITIGGISNDRAAIIEYVNLLGVGQSNICKKVTVPVKTYIKKTDVPFTILCVLQYENK